MPDWTTDFAGGSGRIFDVVRRDDTWDVTFAAESRAGEPRPVWFDVRLTGLASEGVREICLHVVNAVQWLGDPFSFVRDRFVYRAADGEWLRSGPCAVCLDADHTLGVSCRIPCIAPEMEIAFCYPYGEADFAKTAGENAAASVIGVTRLGRPLRRYIFGASAPEKPDIYAIARQHSGEVTGSYVLDGMIRASREAPRGCLWCVPFADADGVAEGWYGKDQFGGDFNRSWNGFFVTRTETAAVMFDIDRFRECTAADWVLDLHSPGHDETASYFVAPFPEDSGDSRLAKLLALRERFNEALRANGYREVGIYFARGNTSSQNGKSATSYLTDAGLCAVTLECAYQGEPDRPYTQEDYRRIGALLYGAASAEGSRKG